MSSKQLEIVVKARDEANSVFSAVGEGARKLSEGLHGASETGHELHKTMRSMQHAFVALEVAPVAIDAIDAVIETLSGDVTRAAEAQRKLFDGIKEIPIIGNKLSAFAESAHNSFAKLIGHETTSDIEAQAAKIKKSLLDLSDELPKIEKDLRLADNSVSLLGLSASDDEIEKANQKFRETIDKTYDQRGIIINARRARQDKEYGNNAVDLFNDSNGNGSKAFQEEERQLKNIDRLNTDAETIRQSAIKSANEKRVAESQALAYKLLDIAAQSAEKLADLETSAQGKELELENRGYAAKILAMNRASEQQIAGIEHTTQEEIHALEARRQALQDHGGKQEEIDSLSNAITDLSSEGENQQAGVARNLGDSQKLAEQNQIREARVAGLRLEADAGNASAKAESEKLQTLREQEATENALLAIGDKRALNEFHQSQYAAEVYRARSSELSILERQASLGDEDAKQAADLLRFTIEQEQAAARLTNIGADAVEQKKQLDALAGQRGDKSQQDSATFLLQQEASLGDKVAERMLKKIELEKQFAAERAKALAVLKEDASTQAQRDKARALLSSLDAVQKRAESQLGGVDRQPGGAALVDEHYLTGQTASINQERDQYQPIVDAQNANKTVNENMAGLLKDILSALQSGGRAKKLT